jgi:hypothetical protein
MNRTSAITQGELSTSNDRKRPIATVSNELKRESYSQHADLEWFKENQSRLVEQYNGKTLIIRYQAVEGVFDVEFDAYLDARRRFTPGTFSIQECVPGEEAYTSYAYFGVGGSDH